MARGEPIPEGSWLLSRLVAESTQIVDSYEAAGMPKPSLTDLGPEFAHKALTCECWR